MQSIVEEFNEGCITTSQPRKSVHKLHANAQEFDCPGSLFIDNNGSYVVSSLSYKKKMRGKELILNMTSGPLCCWLKWIIFKGLRDTMFKKTSSRL